MARFTIVLACIAPLLLHAEVKVVTTITDLAEFLPVVGATVVCW